MKQNLKVISLLIASSAVLIEAKQNQLNLRNLDQQKQWTNGNGDGSEKFDYWQHLEQDAKITKQKFYIKASQPFLGADNRHDTEPKSFAQRKDWTDENGGGSNKADYWYHLDNETKNTKKFNDKAAHPLLKNTNQNDQEPVSHPNGFSFNKQGQAMNELERQNKSKWWVDGNGGGSEKWDHFQEIARFSHSPQEFYNYARNPLIPSLNSNDQDPVNHKMGINNVQIEKEKQWWVDGNGGGSEKWDHFQELGRFSKNADDFYRQARHPLIPSLNSNDQDPVNHKMGINNAQIQKDQQWWVDGNGGGSEKWDHFQEIARFSHSPQEFYNNARHPLIPSLNSNDQDPVYHNMGIQNAQLEKSQQQWVDGNGGGSEKWDHFQELSRFSKNTDDFYRQARYPFIASLNNYDTEPVSHAQIQADESEKKKYDYYWSNLRDESKNTQDFYNRASKPDLKASHEKDQEPTFHPTGFSFSQYQ